MVEMTGMEITGVEMVEITGGGCIQWQDDRAGETQEEPPRELPLRGAQGAS